VVSKTMKRATSHLPRWLLGSLIHPPAVSPNFERDQILTGHT